MKYKCGLTTEGTEGLAPRSRNRKNAYHEGTKTRRKSKEFLSTDYTDFADCYVLSDAGREAITIILAARAADVQTLMKAA